MWTQRPPHPKNHGISKQVGTGDLTEPCVIHIQTPLFWRVQSLILRVSNKNPRLPNTFWGDIWTPKTPPKRPFTSAGMTGSLWKISFGFISTVFFLGVTFRISREGVFFFSPSEKPLEPKTFNRSGQIIIFHQPRFPWNKGISLTKAPFGVRSCEVAIIWRIGEDWRFWSLKDHGRYTSGRGALVRACWLRDAWEIEWTPLLGVFCWGVVMFTWNHVYIICIYIYISKPPIYRHWWIFFTQKKFYIVFYCSLPFPM